MQVDSVEIGHETLVVVGQAGGGLPDRARICQRKGCRSERENGLVIALLPTLDGAEGLHAASWPAPRITGRVTMLGPDFARQPGEALPPPATPGTSYRP